MYFSCYGNFKFPLTCNGENENSRSQIFYVKVLCLMFAMFVFVKHLMELIPVWQCDRNWSKILCGGIPNPVHDLKVKVTDLEFLYKSLSHLVTF